MEVGTVRTVETVERELRENANTAAQAYDMARKKVAVEQVNCCDEAIAGQSGARPLRCLLRVLYCNNDV